MCYRGRWILAFNVFGGMTIYSVVVAEKLLIKQNHHLAFQINRRLPGNSFVMSCLVQSNSAAKRHVKKPVWILSGEKSIRNFIHCNKWPLLVLGPTWIENRPYFDQLKHCQNTTLCDKKKERVKYYTMDPYLTKTNWSRDMHIFQRTKCVESITFWNPLKRQICMVNLDSKRAWSMPDKFQFDMTAHITNGSRSWKWMVG